MTLVIFKAPEVNPITHKARSIPVLNPTDRYGRVFFFSWLGFMVAFLSWYAFPPLVSAPGNFGDRQPRALTSAPNKLTITIRDDLNMTQEDVANSNIVALLATLVKPNFCFFPVLVATPRLTELYLQASSSLVSRPALRSLRASLRLCRHPPFRSSPHSSGGTGYRREGLDSPPVLRRYPRRLFRSLPGVVYGVL